MPKTVVILQSNYIPWKGYFDLIKQADEFIFYDEVQYTVRDWRNRNRIKSPQGLRWLTIPVGQRIDRKIFEVEMSNQIWKKKHWEALNQAYKHAPYIVESQELFEQLYTTELNNLSEYNQHSIAAICKWIGIETAFSDSRTYKAQGDRLEKLSDILTKSGADRLLCGPNVKKYLKETDLTEKGFSLEIIDYSHYPEYAQLYSPFTHQVSILDLIVHVGKKHVLEFL